MIVREPAPLPYFERIKPGDVAYIRRGCLNLLFSAGSPLNGRELGVDVPHTFKELDVGPIFSAHPLPPGYLPSNTVRARPRRPCVHSIVSVSSRTSGVRVFSSISEPGSSISFRFTGDQGAALLTKYPTYREDIQRERTFEEYTKAHYDSWVAFARQRGHGSDIKPVLVTGVDRTKDFAMMSYSNDDDGLEAEFATSDSETASPWGTWRTTGAVHTKCGPQSCRPPTLTRATDSDVPPSDYSRAETVSDETPPENSRAGAISDEYNNCVFVRYYTVRKRLGIPRIMKAAAGPHDLGSGARDDQELSLETECGSDSDPDSDNVSRLFDDDDDDDGSSVSSVESESDIVIHNTIPVRCLPLFSSFLAIPPF